MEVCPNPDVASGLLMVCAFILNIEGLNRVLVKFLIIINLNSLLSSVDDMLVSNEYVFFILSVGSDV